MAKHKASLELHILLRRFLMLLVQLLLLSWTTRLATIYLDLLCTRLCLRLLTLLYQAFVDISIYSLISEQSFMVGCIHFSSVAQSCLTPCDPMDCLRLYYPHFKMRRPCTSHICGIEHTKIPRVGWSWIILLMPLLVPVNPLCEADSSPDPGWKFWPMNFLISSR